MSRKPKCCSHGTVKFKRCPMCGVKIVNCEVAFNYFKDSLYMPVAYENGHCYGHKPVPEKEGKEE